MNNGISIIIIGMFLIVPFSENVFADHDGFVLNGESFDVTHFHTPLPPIVMPLDEGIWIEVGTHYLMHRH